MKQSVNFNDFVNAFHAYGRYDQFGYQALRIIFDYLEQYEKDCNEELELDVVAFCCDYSSENWEDIAREYSIDLNDADQEDDEYEDQCKAIVLDYLNDNTLVLGETDCEIVYRCF